MKKFAISSLLVVPMIFAVACGSAQDQVSESSALPAGTIVRSAAGDILKTVEAYRADLGGANNGVAAGSQANGRREIAWDGVPANISSKGAANDPNRQNFPGDTFKNRGILISTQGGKLEVSTKLDEAAQAAPRFGNLNANFPKIFGTFSPEKLFSPVSSTVTDLTFTVPGTDKPATVSGFGAVFTDVDQAGISKIEYYDIRGQWLHTEWAKPVQWKNQSLTFVGVSFKDKKIGKVKIYSGNIKLGQWKNEDQWNDAVALDDFIFAEPKAVAQW